MSDELLTADDVAAAIKDVTAEWVIRKTRSENWPHVKFSRKTIRYRAEDVLAIVALHRQDGATIGAGSGLTAASRRRAS